MGSILLLCIRDFSFAFIVAVGFAVLFHAPARILHVAGLLGGLGHSLRFILVEYVHMGIIPATLAGSVAVGLLGIFAAHKVHTPPVVFTMPACITMIPGLYGYRAMLGFMKITDLEQVRHEPGIWIETIHYSVLTLALLLVLAIGICSGALLFRKKSVKSLFRKSF
jgi:uncharacterized membrane protein YjjB (DUF3815 family)